VRSDKAKGFKNLLVQLSFRLLLVALYVGPLFLFLEYDIRFLDLRKGRAIVAMLFFSSLPKNVPSNKKLQEATIQRENNYGHSGALSLLS
jgi:hypothetical protein